MTCLTTNGQNDSNNWQSEASLDGQFEGTLEFDFGDVYAMDRPMTLNNTLEDIRVEVVESPDVFAVHLRLARN